MKYLIAALAFPTSAFAFQPLPIPQCSGFHAGESAEVQREAQDCVLRKNASQAFNVSRGDAGKAIAVCATMLGDFYGVSQSNGVKLCNMALVEMGQ